MQQCIRYSLIILSLIFFSSIPLSAQTEECSTQDTDPEIFATRPWYGNDTFLPAFLADVEASRSDKITRIPIQFIVVLTNAETIEGAMPNNFGFLMNTINEGYQSNGLKFNFVMLCPKIVRRANTATTQAQDLIINGLNRTTGAINVIIKTSKLRYFNPAGGYIAIPRNRDNNAENAITLIHEIGHYFGLDHTHAGHLNGSAGTLVLPCLKEDVRRDIYY